MTKSQTQTDGGELTEEQNIIFERSLKVDPEHVIEAARRSYTDSIVWMVRFEHGSLYNMDEETQVESRSIISQPAAKSRTGNILQLHANYFLDDEYQPGDDPAEHLVDEFVVAGFLYSVEYTGDYDD